jgi:hypothetical protein
MNRCAAHSTPPIIPVGRISSHPHLDWSAVGSIVGLAGRIPAIVTFLEDT